MMPMPPEGQSAPAAPHRSRRRGAARSDPDQQGAAPEGAGMQQAALDAPAAATPPPTPETETGSIALPPCPSPELVEQSQYGPLPKIAADGRRDRRLCAAVALRRRDPRRRLASLS